MKVKTLIIIDQIYMKFVIINFRFKNITFMHKKKITAFFKCFNIYTWFNQIIHFACGNKIARK